METIRALCFLSLDPGDQMLSNEAALTNPTIGALESLSSGLAPVRLAWLPEMD